MKKLAISCVVFLAISSQAFASFIPRMNFFVNREVAIARVWNTTHGPIVCNGQAFGRTRHGVVLNSWVHHLVIYPMTSVDVYVHSNFYDPFVQAWASINCNHLHGW